MYGEKKIRWSFANLTVQKLSKLD